MLHFYSGQPLQNLSGVDTDQCPAAAELTIEVTLGRCCEESEQMENPDQFRDPTIDVTGSRSTATREKIHERLDHSDSGGTF